MLSAQRADWMQATLTVYGSTRMLLAATDAELLPLLVCHRPCKDGAAAAGDGLQELLQPLRAVRPANGGAGCTGYEDEVALMVCALAYDL